MAIRQNLDFDMPGLSDEFLYKNPVVPKAAGRFILGRLEPLAGPHIIPCDAHSLAAATCTGFDQHGVANAVGLALQERRPSLWGVIPRSLTSSTRRGLNSEARAPSLEIVPSPKMKRVRLWMSNGNMEGYQ